MESLGAAAKRLLQRLDRDAQARKQAPGRLKGREELKEPGAAPSRQQTPGNTALGGQGDDHAAGEWNRSGLEKDRGSSSVISNTSVRRAPYAGEDIGHKDRAVAPRVSGKLRNAAGARLGGVGYSSSLPAVLIASNDNRKCRHFDSTPDIGWFSLDRS